MEKNLDIQIEEALKAYWASGVEDQVDYQKSYLYSIVTTVTKYLLLYTPKRFIQFSIATKEVH